MLALGNRIPALLRELRLVLVQALDDHSAAGLHAARRLASVVEYDMFPTYNLVPILYFPCFSQ